MSDFTIPNLFNVKGKIAVVTGGGSGIGTMIASAYVQNGAKVYIASRKEEQLKEVSEKLNKIGPGSCEYVVADLSSKAGCDHLVEAIKAKEEKVHILVSNSGMSWGAPFDNFPEKEGWDRLFALNVKSIFYVTAGFTPLLAKDSNNHDPARVINISSIAGLSPIADRSKLAGNGNGLWSYHTSKAAVNHLTSQLAVTLGPQFITVNAICPGVFPSKMTAFGFKRAGAEGMAGGHPWGRVGEPTDMAGVALFLASPAASYVTGAHISLDGGGLLAGSTGSRL
ncbi:rhamnolipids biosynthesis 3-oxoacyl-reductase [Russula ochroleuca]|jgi:NAD(P)-dependent dehydrogenase (short-subunit alcohol dehydrogenase family)|uniref:Rhamnolipids biosynthesis 3-oxoacyl-reductase n=1 Tax=Russula ochroleuca TaxID=152965 RepID=A0A9P5MWB7_9AGAM|nr:rhamnolipids biosynthesis 3-oxoacyl-reductase [Russula ochroleuca]